MENETQPPPPDEPRLPPPPPAGELPPPPPEDALPAPGGTEPAAEPAAKVKKEPKKPKKKYVYELKLFEKYDLSEVAVHDPGLARYINLTAIVIPHTGGRSADHPLGEPQTHNPQRLLKRLVRSQEGARQQ